MTSLAQMTSALSVMKEEQVRASANPTRHCTARTVVLLPPFGPLSALVSPLLLSFGPASDLLRHWLFRLPIRGQARPLLEQFLKDIALVEGSSDVAREFVEEAEAILSGAAAGADEDGDDQREQQPKEKAEEGEERSGKGEEGMAEEEAGGGSSGANNNSISSASNKSPGTSGGGGSRRHSYGCSRRGVLSAALAEVSSKASASPSASQDRTGEREAGRRTAALLRSAVERYVVPTTPQAELTSPPPPFLLRLPEQQQRTEEGGVKEE